MRAYRKASFLVVPVVLCLMTYYGGTIEARDYTLSDGPPKLSFRQRDDLGYVVHNREGVLQPSQLDAIGSKAGLEMSAVKGISCGDTRIISNGAGVAQAVLSLQSSGSVGYVSPLFSSNGQAVAILPEVVVRLKEGAAREELAKWCQEHGVSIIRSVQFTDREYLIDPHASVAADVFSVVESISSAVFCKWAIPSVAFEPELFGEVIPDDPNFCSQWHLKNTGQSGGTVDADINVCSAWEKETGDPDIVIAVLDSGVDLGHPDLVDNLTIGYDFYDDDNEPHPTGDSAHGTACAGLIGARGNNGIGLSGVLWQCGIMPIRIAGGAGFVSESSIAEAIRWAAANGADVLSNSWGGVYSMPLIKSAIEDITQIGGVGREGKGCVVVFAAGNSGGTIYYPASYDEVIAVGSTNEYDGLWDYSCRGPELDIVAPSGDTNLNGNIWTTDIIGSSGYNNRDSSILDYTDRMGGTSGACPLVAGVAAMVLSVDPDITNDEVRFVLEFSAVDMGDPGRDDLFGHGRLDAMAAITFLTEHPKIIMVDDDAVNDPMVGDPDISDPLEDGSMEHPFDSIQEAIDEALPMDTVFVLDGVYSGHGNRDLDLGGKNITIRSSYGPEGCIINCQGNSTEYRRAFYFHNDETNMMVVDGFTIINGYHEIGGGIYCDNSSPTIQNCKIIGNTADNGSENGLGGGVYCGNTAVVIRGCEIAGNVSSYRGGGLYCGGDDCQATVEDCEIIGNEAQSEGGALYLYEAKARVINCLIQDNRALGIGGGALSCYDSAEGSSIWRCRIIENRSGIGGGIYCSGSANAIRIGSCTIVANVAEVDGGGIYCIDGRPRIGNCTISGNKGGELGGGISSYNSMPPVNNCILWDNTPNEICAHPNEPSISFSNVEGGTLSGLNNSDFDPCFVLSGYWDGDVWIPGDYHLTWNSPCIDQGDPNYVPDPNGYDLDIDGEPRMMTITDDLRDIGSDEIGPKQTDLTRDGIVDIYDAAVFFSAWLSNRDDENWCELCNFCDYDEHINMADWSAFAADWHWQEWWYNQ